MRRIMKSMRFENIFKKTEASFKLSSDAVIHALYPLNLGRAILA